MAIDGAGRLSNFINLNSKELNKSFERLSSGKRINRAQDDAAGLAVVSALEADVKTSLQGARNAVDGVSIASIADGALSQISDIGSRQSELAAQAANGALSDDQRQALNNEYQQLEQEKSRILQTTEFNGVNVFSGATLQVGSDGSSSSQIGLPAVSTASVTSPQDISTQAGARSAIDALSTQNENLNQVRGQVGSVVNRVEVAEENARSRAVESESAASRIRDADIADESAKNVASRIKQDINVALQAQANKINSDSVLRLLN
jgi:flagellin